MMACGTGRNRGETLMGGGGCHTPPLPLLIRLLGLAAGKVLAWGFRPGPSVPLNQPAPAHFGPPWCVFENNFDARNLEGTGGFAPYTPDPNPVNFSTEAEGTNRNPDHQFVVIGVRRFSCGGGEVRTPLLTPICCGPGFGGDKRPLGGAVESSPTEHRNLGHDSRTTPKGHGSHRGPWSPIFRRREVGSTCLIPIYLSTHAVQLLGKPHPRPTLSKSSRYHRLGSGVTERKLPKPCRTK